MGKGTQNTKGATTVLRNNDGEVKAVIVNNVTFDVPSTFVLKLQRDTDEAAGNARLKPGAAKAYQSFIINMGDGIMMRGQFYVPASLLTQAARDNARFNADRAAEAEEAEGDKPQRVKRAAGSLG
jgi:hypothetical protein